MHDLVDERGLGDTECVAGRVRLSELIGALSAALDMAEGSNVGHSVRTCYVATRIGARLQLPEAQQRDLYYASLLKDAGCSSNAARLCSLFGADDRELKRIWREIDWTSLADLFGYLRRGVEPDASTATRLRRVASLCVSGFRESRALQRNRCERGADIVRKLGFSAAVGDAVYALDEHWDGHGLVAGMRGDEIPIVARIVCLAQTAEVFLTAGGTEALLAMLSARTGRWFDPELVALLAPIASERAFWEDVRQPDMLSLVAALEPGIAVAVDDERLDAIAEAFADVVDAKSPFTGRHSRDVATIAEEAATDAGLSQPAWRELYRAGLLHDLGKLGVPNTVLDKPGTLTGDELKVLRMHPLWTQQILLQVPALSRIAEIAVAHHERMDGRGYHRGIPAGACPFAARLLAAVDVYDALSADRPCRASLPIERVTSLMREMAGPHLDPDAVELVLHRAPTTRLAAA